MTKMRDVLTVLGFREVHAPLSAQQTGFAIDLGNVELTVIECVDRNFRTVLLMTGLGRSKDGRTMTDIEYSLPLEVQSFEQGVALVVYAIGNSVEPAAPPPWYELGKSWKHTLPWAKGVTGPRA